MTNCKTSREEAKDKEWLRTGLILHIILDWVRDEVLDLKEYLQEAHPGDCRQMIRTGCKEGAKARQEGL